MVRRTKEDAVATRSSLLDAAERVFYEKGVSRASLGDIAQAAGATRGAIYWHFKDKLDLFNAMMDRVTLPLENVAYGASEVSEGETPLSRLRGVVEEVLRMVASDERTRRVFEVALYRVEYVHELSAVRERRISVSGAFTRQLAVDLERSAQAQGLVLRMSPGAAAIGLHALFDGLMQGWVLNHGDFDLVAVGREAVDAYLAGLGFDLGEL
ncbi:MAG: TetR family transcriptional regulator [Burkholderiaceae bacterium]|nr:MAG: TetR family transcriptional regulator [Burkholderiaceae bacterium]